MAIYATQQMVCLSHSRCSMWTTLRWINNWSCSKWANTKYACNVKNKTQMGLYKHFSKGFQMILEVKNQIKN